MGTPVCEQRDRLGSPIVLDLDLVPSKSWPMTIGAVSPAAVTSIALFGGMNDSCPVTCGSPYSLPGSVLPANTTATTTITTRTATMMPTTGIERDDPVAVGWFFVDVAKGLLSGVRQ